VSRGAIDGCPRFRPLGRSHYRLSPHVPRAESYRLSEGDIIKMGACSVLVDSVQVAGSRRSVAAREIPRLTDQAESEVLEDESDCGEGDEACGSPLNELDAAGANVADRPDCCYICLGEDESEHSLIPSPCPCKAKIHKDCIKQWVKTKGTRACPICKSRLPVDVATDPPFILFQVIRHMRGLSWSTDREFVVSFAKQVAEEPLASHAVTLGSQLISDIRLPDPSMSKRHAELVYDATTRAFRLRDIGSRAGTYIKMSDPHKLTPLAEHQVKFSRTVLRLVAGRFRDIKTVIHAADTRSATHATTTTTIITPPAIQPVTDVLRPMVVEASSASTLNRFTRRSLPSIPVYLAPLPIVPRQTPLGEIDEDDSAVPATPF
jgi:hypothetical protein